jgi:hypothetical protein
MTHIIGFFASLGMVGAKSLQQLNVAHERIFWIPPVSYGLAALEIYIWSKAPSADLFFWFCVGTGAWLGSVIAVLAHRRLRNSAA